MHLTFHQLTTFREVMRSGSISQAARAVGRTQPAVSTLVATLERELGFALFLREHGKLTPTPEAHYLLEEADAVLSRLDRTKRTLTRVGALEAGKLRLACHPAASGLFMPRALTAFLEDHADVDVSLIMRSSAVIEDLVAAQRFDLGLAETPVRRASIDQVDFDLDCVCVLRADDPLAGRDRITPHDLDGRPMAVLFDEHPSATQTEAAFHATGTRFNKRIELRTSLPGLQFVSEGFCYMVCDMITAYSHVLRGTGFPNLVLRKFTPRISDRISILTPAYVSRSMLARAFADHLQDAIRAMQTDTTAHLEASAASSGE